VAILVNLFERLQHEGIGWRLAVERIRQARRYNLTTAKIARRAHSGPAPYRALSRSLHLLSRGYDCRA
jgi:hypothetical protein